MKFKFRKLAGGFLLAVILATVTPVLATSPCDEDYAFDMRNAAQVYTVCMLDPSNGPAICAGIYVGMAQTAEIYWDICHYLND